MSRYSISPLLLAVALLGCQSISSQKTRTVSLDQEITLSPAGRAVLDQQGLEVQFLGVTEDSRCPLGLACVWAGEVKVRLAIHSEAAGTSQHDVLERQSAVIEQYRVTVLTVRPEPVSTRKISPAEYRATLKVERR